jgi:hypothetical protein
MKLKSMAFSCSVVATLAFALSAFGEDAYIENTNGNQYFNTGYFVGPHTRIEIDLQLLEVKGQIRPFGVYGAADATHPYCALYLGQAVTGGPWVWSYQASKSDYSSQAWNAGGCPADLERHKIVLDFNSNPKKFEVWTGDTKDVNRELANVSAGTQTYPLGLFAQCRHAYGMYSSTQNTFDNPAKMRLYSFRIYESGTLVKEFLPWVKGGIAGLKETKSGQFHSGENARACVAGGDVTIEKDDPYVSMPGNDVNQRNAVVGKTQYFETGYTFTPNSRLELDFAALTPDWTQSTKWAYETHVFFANGNGFMLHLMPYGSNTNLWYYKIGTAEARIPGAGIDYAYNVRRKVSASATQMRMETAGFTNFTITSSQPITANLGSTKLQLGLRAGNFPACPIKIYGLKIYETANGVETLVRDYRPCISNSVPILRDTLAAPTLGLLPTVYGSRNSTVYGSPDNNAHTNIVCEAGGDIPGDDEAKEAYLDFDGVDGHLINTEYVVTKDSRVETDFAVWNNNFRLSATAAPVFFHQSSGTDGIWFSLYYPSGAFRYGWRFSDYNTGKNEWFKKAFITNERIKFVFDAPNDTVTSYRKGVQSETFKLAYDTGTLTATTCSTTLRIGGSCDGRYAAGMRLYSVKIYKSGVLDRCFVPCLTNGVAGLYETCQNRFFPLTGGKVRGKGYQGQTGEFEISPQPATLTYKEGENSTTLTCLAAGAQSYEWYEDGVLMPGETSDSLTLTWIHTKAKAKTHTYSVKPIYTVFNERVVGEPVSATVEYTPLGTRVIIK